MNFKTLTVSIVVLLAIAAPAVANPNWKSFGRSNGGSDIALDLDSIATSTSRDFVYFQYKTTKNGKTTKHTGGTNLCSQKNPAAWLAIHPDGSAPSAVVAADSPASKAMLKTVCQVFNSASKSEPRSIEACQRSRLSIFKLRSTMAGSPDNSFTQYFQGMIDDLEEIEKKNCQ